MTSAIRQSGRAMTVGLLWGLLGASGAQAVVEKGHWSFSNKTLVSPSALPVNFTIGVDQTPIGDGTGVLLNFDSATRRLTGITYNLDEGADLFVVSKGLGFTEAWGDTHGQSFLMGPSSSKRYGTGSRFLPPQTIEVGKDFYLGVQTRSGIYDSFNVFGWAHFKVDIWGQVNMVESAMAYGEQGIVIGQMTAVPEPATWASLLLGLSAMGALSHRKNKTTSQHTKA